MVPEKMGHNVWQLQEVGANQHEYSCEEPNFHKPQMFLRNTKPPIYCRCCYALALFLSLYIISIKSPVIPITG